jgi:hypothetical protein
MLHKRPHKPRQSLTPPKSHTSFTISHTLQEVTQAQTVTYSTKKPHKLHHSPYSTKGPTSPIPQTLTHICQRFHKPDFTIPQTLQEVTQAQTVTYFTKKSHKLHHSPYSTKGPTSPIPQTLTHICQRFHKPDFTITHTPQKATQASPFPLLHKRPHKPTILQRSHKSLSFKIQVQGHTSQLSYKDHTSLQVFKIQAQGHASQPFYKDHTSL